MAQEEECGQQRVTLEILLRGYGATLSPINPAFFLPPLRGHLSKQQPLLFHMWQEFNYSTFSTFKLWLNKRQSWLIPFPRMCNSLAVKLHCSWTRMRRHNRIIVLENFVTIWAEFLQRETVFFCREILVLIFVLAVSHSTLITAPVVTSQGPLEGINYCRLSPLSKDTDLRPPGADCSSQLLEHRHSATLTFNMHSAYALWDTGV